MTFPNVADALWDWTSPINLRVVTKTAVDFEAQESLSDPIIFDGVIQPMPTQKLLVKPEGQRLWKWWELWTQKELMLDDVIIDPDGKSYRVMSKSDWNQSSYFEYQLTEGPQ